KHSGEAIKAGLPPLPVSFEEHLGIAVGAKPMSEFLQFGADFLEIVDFAVKDQPIARLSVIHGHVPRGREVKDSQPPAPHADASLHVGAKRKNFDTFIIRPTMSQRPYALAELRPNFN